MNHLYQSSSFIPVEEAVKSRGKAAARFDRFNTNDLMAAVFPAVRWIVPDYLPEGFSVLAGRQKLGKTWMAIDFALAVASGGCALGSIECEAGNVLYIDMENGPRRIQRRIEAVYPDDANMPDLSRLDWVTEAPALNAGFIGALTDWRDSVPHPRLIVIDVLQRIKPAGNGKQNAYESDYACFSELQTWATENRIAVLALHHTRKGGADDPLEALTGSNGLSAVADTTLVLDRDGNGMTLYVRGRDVEERETAVRFDAGIFTMLGDAAEVRRSDGRAKILEFLSDAEEPERIGAIVAGTGMKRSVVDTLLHRMAKAGEVIKAGRGLYIHQNRSDLLD
ncbi:MAG: AAA family ATPase [Hoeflea sp.]|uniref:AAA family ATPase n=1 Tax=Hoeflea sp. TaxID=1940281 RepID=UPI0032EBCCCD